jgi:phosphoribosylformimino-5-aminoimidazole carboxamide ribotide isomerase
MSNSSDFAVIPALDLKDGVVVHAKGGARADYRPVASLFGAADDPLRIAHGLLAVTGSSVLYVADLDAIMGTGTNFELVRGLSYALPDTTVWIDAGFSRVADCAFWLPLGATLVIGSEALAAIEDWRDLREEFGEDLVLSLDFDSAGRRGPGALFDDRALWPGRVIAMHLGRVGGDQGPDADGLGSLIAMADGCSIFAAGGIRNAKDLAAVAAAGARGAVLSTALHKEALTQNEIAALLRERRS